MGFDSSDLDLDELDIIRGDIEHSKSLYYEGFRYHKVHDSYLTFKNRKRSIVNPQNCGGIVYLIRNPLDIAISLSHFFQWDVEDCVKFLLDENASLCSSKRKIGFQVRQFLGDWEFHINSWINQKDIPILVIRYEDLLEKPLVFRKIAEFLKIKANDKLIQKAISNSAFDKLQNKEKIEGGFCEKPEKCEKFLDQEKLEKAWKN